MVWRQYLKYREEKDKDKPIKINFRNKDNGWSDFQTYFKYSDREYKEKHNKDLFMKAFLSNLCLRESCYDCKFKKKNRLSDITIGDLWGIDNIIPRMNDDKGVSVVIINSEKGKKIFEIIKEKCIYEKINLDDVIKYNPNMIKSCLIPQSRNEFLENIKDGDFSVITNKYLPKVSVLIKVKGKIKKVLKKVMKKVLIRNDE